VVIPLKPEASRQTNAARLPQLAQPSPEAARRQAWDQGQPPDPPADVRIAGYNTGGDLKDVQAQMRHASVTTTANIYTKPIPKSVRKAVEALDRRIRKRGQAKKS
jgi:hypothetical protein